MQLHCNRMSELVRITKYYCKLCENNRNIELNEALHFEKIKNSDNGLVLYSDIHYCKDRITGVNNLRIDGNFAIRAFEAQELPPVRSAHKFAIPGVGKIISKTYGLKKLYITHLDLNTDFKLIIKDEPLMTIMNFGVDEEEIDFPIQSITSDLGTIILTFYESDIVYSQTIEKWLYVLVNSLEILPPTRFGLVLETIKYIMNFHNEEPTKFEISLIRTMLASHEIYFQITSDPDRYDNVAVQLSSILSGIDTTFLMEILVFLELNPSAPLIEYIKTHHYDLEYLIYLFLILEKENFIIIDRPGILDC
ncbi:MAG: hypothetical protein HeimC2_45150 [Candidatus Heimdallarchaeota archaeon LC_2]|nr:MAG: hypothetical protein HeimC2_45150 [Candidatus Heimdallarchaeota archaeon LC_2]